MWPVRGFPYPLPEHLLLFENDDCVYVTCSRCGWQAVFVAGVKAEEIQKAARVHGAECPPR